MRQHMTYANVVATLALLFAMSGGALAANHYLLTSTKQIKPSVLAKLRGKSGPRGAPGVVGPAGLPGLPGLAGLAGQRGDTGAGGLSGSTAGTVVTEAGGATILTDATIGLRVSQSTGSFSFVFANTNTTDRLSIYGVVVAQGAAPLAWEAIVQPGQSVKSPSNAAVTEFLDTTVTRAGDTIATSPMVHVTCGVDNQSSAAANCLAAH